MKKLSLFLSLFLSFSALLSTAQTVSPSRQAINKVEISGLNLTTSIPSKELKGYWESYIAKYGKVNNRRGVTTLDQAIIPAVATRPLKFESTITNSKNISSLFLAVSDNGNYISTGSDAAYVGAENFLKEFLVYATAQEEVRLVKEDYKKSTSDQAKLVKDKEKLLKNIEKSEKDLDKLRQELLKKESDIESFNTILLDKKKGVQEVERKNK